MSSDVMGTNVTHVDLPNSTRVNGLGIKSTFSSSDGFPSSARAPLCPSGAAARHRRKHKSFKAHAEAVVFTLDDRVNLDRLELLGRRGVVGRVQGTKVSQIELDSHCWSFT